MIKPMCEIVKLRFDDEMIASQKTKSECESRSDLKIVVVLAIKNMSLAMLQGYNPTALTLGPDS